MATAGGDSLTVIDGSALEGVNMRKIVEDRHCMDVILKCERTPFSRN